MNWGWSAGDGDDGGAKSSVSYGETMIEPTTHGAVIGESEERWS